MVNVTDDQVVLRAKTPEEIAAWLPGAMRAYEEARMEAGDTPEQAEAGRIASEGQFFPDGRLIDSHVLFTIVVDGADAGWLWLGPFTDAAAEDWWVWDIRVFDEFQRRGIARVVMRRADDIAREHGAATLGLNAFAGNVAAITLYQSLGFLTTSLHMRKVLA